MGDHVIAITEALLAEVTNEGSVTVLERGSWTRRLKRSLASAADHNTAATTNQATPTDHSTTPSALSHGHSLLVLTQSTKLLFTFLLFVAFRITDGMRRFEMVEELRFVPERLQAHAASNAVIFVIEQL